MWVGGWCLNRKSVKQSSVLSTAFFLLVMNPLLCSLDTLGMGVCVCQFYYGGSLHADDIRTISSSEETMNRQVDLLTW